MTIVKRDYDGAGRDDDTPALIESPLSSTAWRKNWARLIQKIYIDISAVPAGQYYVCVEIEPSGYFIYGCYGGDSSQPFYPKVLVDIGSGASLDIYVDVT